MPSQVALDVRNLELSPDRPVRGQFKLQDLGPGCCMLSIGLSVQDSFLSMGPWACDKPWLGSCNLDSMALWLANFLKFIGFG